MALTWPRSSSCCRYRKEQNLGTTEFQSAIDRGEPLADVTVVFHEGVDPIDATDRLNALAEDFDLCTKPWYNAPRMRIGTATKAALERLFGWRIVRTPVADQNGYVWATVTAPNRWPDGFESSIASIGLSQPGADDDGQWYEWPDDKD